ncbi:RloB domain-containing protein [Acinetobacter nosocomialis]|uniref:RloB domain-containing protein n=1 Tax=Acinetobacter nosocomialis TaxID=106654 RepID=UPI0026EA7802|nr:RloB domain-containing protein [Acinetobacter nosocomialis]MDO7213849.1 RloB domain-containing protein [Acinetobacter nosocomialis]MDQ9029475.1 RloB domain-containing protein [Acinetobacter nosocomialis]MDQ9046749.1 RloB domain-containing protein [Acinetobacter nosocomialis]MDQ9084163.1 RloB domain-containing protein [Acinetobacter nosocomialis]
MARTSKFRDKKQGKTNIYILVDGECESDYLTAFKRSESYKTLLKHVDIKPDLPKSKSIESQFEELCTQLNHYSKVIWVVDYDVISKETGEQRKGTETSEQKFNKYKKRLEKLVSQKRYEGVELHILINNPSIEYWYLLHYEATGKHYQTSSEAEKHLKKHLKNYTKFDAIYRRQIFSVLEPKLSDAINNAKRIVIEDDTEILARADLYKIFENNCELLTRVIDKK